MKIPQVGCVLGSCTAGGAYIPALCDEVVVVKDSGRVYLAGPPLVKAATGEECTEEELGGGTMHTSKSGVLDHLANTEEEALAKTRICMEHINRYIPRAQLDRKAPEEPYYPTEDILGVIPEDNRIPYDVREVIARVFDGSRFHEFKPRYGPTLVCGFARLYGYPVGIVANNGMLFVESTLKATQFINICGHRKIPLIFLHNITGFMVGKEYEQAGITKAGAKMITAVSCVPVPKFAIILGGSHGAGNYAMCGRAFSPRFTFLWPNAKICVMGGEQAAGVLSQVKQNQMKREKKPPLTEEQLNAMKQPIIDMYEKHNDAYNSTGNLMDEGIIDPRDTRKVLGRCISVCLNAKWPTGDYGVFRM